MQDLTLNLLLQRDYCPPLFDVQEPGLAHGDLSSTAKKPGKFGLVPVILLPELKLCTFTVLNTKIIRIVPRHHVWWDCILGSYRIGRYGGISPCRHPQYMEPAFRVRHCLICPIGARNTNMNPGDTLTKHIPSNATVNLSAVCPMTGRYYLFDFRHHLLA